MTYAYGWALQRAVHAALRAHPDIAALVGGRVHDEPPHRSSGSAEEAAAPYVVIGEETVAPWDTATEAGAAHEIVVCAVAAEPGFATVKRIAAAVCDALLGGLAPERGRVVSARFLGGRTARALRGATRRIDMRFRIVIEE